VQNLQDSGKLQMLIDTVLPLKMKKAKNPMQTAAVAKICPVLSFLNEVIDEHGIFFSM